MFKTKKFSKKYFFNNGFKKRFSFICFSPDILFLASVQVKFYFELLLESSGYVFKICSHIFMIFEFNLK